MKRTSAVSLIGALIAGTTSVLAQGAFQFSNYAEPYVPITYDGVTPVGINDGIQIQVWWGLGAGLTDNDLILGGDANWSLYDGYTDRFQVFELPAFEYESGQTWTLQLRAIGQHNGLPVDSVFARGPLIESADFGDQSVVPPELPTFIYTPGFRVLIPEPSTFALIGLGAAAMLALRRRS